MGVFPFLLLLLPLLTSVRGESLKPPHTIEVQITPDAAENFESSESKQYSVYVLPSTTPRAILFDETLYR